MDDANLKELIARIINKVLSEMSEAKRCLYVVFEKSLTDQDRDFLMKLKWDGDIFVIVPANWGQTERKEIEAVCHRCFVRNLQELASMPKENSLTVYPSVSNTFVAKTALGIYDTDATMWLQNCLKEGTQVQILLSGLEKFTGKEPAPYVEQVLGYYRVLLSFGVKLAFWQQENQNDIEKKKEDVAVKPLVAMSSDYVIKDKVVTANDVAVIPKGATALVAPGAIITEYAREEALRRQITLRRDL